MNFITRDYIDETIGGFDYTKISVRNMNRILDSEEFREMDSQAIFDYLHRQMEMVSFRDYLIRYLNKKADIHINSGQADDQTYVKILKESFMANHAPRTLGARKISFPGLLKAQTVSRNTIFLLGFGLKMTEEEVSEFLTKVILEHDFDMEDRREATFKYCYQNGYEYRKALEILEQEEDPHSLERADNTLTIYRELYQRAQKAAEKVTGESSYNSVETVLCSGMPRKKSGNLIDIRQSALAKHFGQKRMTRQRISKIMKGERQPERFDIITLLFLVYGIEVEPDWPAERFLQYIDEVNDLLDRCHMMGIYPVNPYESYILMCLLTEEPITVYSDIWEMSFE